LWLGVPVLLLLGLGWQNQRASGLAAGKPDGTGTAAEMEGLPNPSVTT
jgi:hypothetical protein